MLSSADTKYVMQQIKYGVDAMFGVAGHSPDWRSSRTEITSLDDLHTRITFRVEGSKGACTAESCTSSHGGRCHILCVCLCGNLSRDPVRVDFFTTDVGVHPLTDDGKNAHLSRAFLYPDQRYTEIYRRRPEAAIQDAYMR